MTIHVCVATCPDCRFPLSATSEPSLMDSLRVHAGYAHRVKTVAVDLTALAGVVQTERAE